MNAITQITENTNALLVSRGLLPLDGYCVCSHCQTGGLRRDQINVINHFDRVCDTCRPLYASDRHECRSCNGRKTVVDEVTHDTYRRVECRDCEEFAEKLALPDADAYFDLMEGGSR